MAEEKEKTEVKEPEKKAEKTAKAPVKKESDAKTEDTKVAEEIAKTEKSGPETSTVKNDAPKAVPSKEKFRNDRKPVFDLGGWQPKTSVGNKVKNKEITSISELLDAGEKIIEPEIVDALVQNLDGDLLMVGQSKGKFGGGARRIFKQTQKKTPEGNKPSFTTVAVIGNRDGYVGIGFGKSKDTVPAREKATRQARLGIFKIRRGCGSWECGCKTPHSIPFAVEGKCGSVRILLMPAPKGKGLCVEPECAKVLKLAGIKDIWSKTWGKTRVTTNLIPALVEALKALTSTKVLPETKEKLGIIEGAAA